ncbi:gag-polypeptide of LTR copia-type [Sesbania bispinosa]|nr:gag-polypeptide of LTR copia-type [Sesbania bispinosa]
MATHIQGIKAISDELSVIDNLLDTTDLVIYTLNGLGVEYREISAVLRARETPIDFAKLHEKLVDIETHLHRDEPSGTNPILATAHVVSRNKGHPKHKFSSNNTSLSSQYPAKKDLKTSQTLMQGPLRQDLYHLSIVPYVTPPPHALTTSIQPFSTWHHKHVNFIENSFPYPSFTQPQSPFSSIPPLATPPHTLIPATGSSHVQQQPAASPHTTTCPDLAEVSSSVSSPAHEDSSSNNTSTQPPFHSTFSNPSRSHPMVTRSQNNIFKPKKILTASKHACST